jgi:hypothetical protein
MTAKEKAEELVEKMYSLQLVSIKFNMPNVAKETAKQCALIAVDEILKVINEYDIEPIIFDIDYWQQVKQEITNL